MRMDEVELNAYLGSNLALKKDDAAPKNDPPPPAPVAPFPAAQASGDPAPAPAASSPSDPSVEEVQSSVRDVEITMAGDQIEAYILFDFHGENLSLILAGRLHVEGGYLHFEPVAGKLGSLPLPQSTLQNAVARLLDSPENREKLRVPPEISDIRVENGELFVVYR